MTDMKNSDSQTLIKLVLYTFFAACRYVIRNDLFGKRNDVFFKLAKTVKTLPKYRDVFTSLEYPPVLLYTFMEHASFLR